MIRAFRLRFLHWRYMRACKRLQRDVEKRARSFEVQDYAKRRKAALKHTRGLA